MKKNNNNSRKEGPQDLNALYRDIVDSTNTLIWRTDVEGRFTFLNPSWEKNYGYKVEDILGRPFSDFQVQEAAEHYINAFRNCLIGEAIIGHETTFFSKSGDEVDLVINMIPLYDSDGAVTGTQGTAFDITESKRADELLQYISAKDELTGLYNLHTFMSMTEQQIKTANREKKQMLIIYTGVDGMQVINDDHGREAGDKILVDAANVLRKTFREADILARTGGDEFVISTLIASKDHDKLIMTRLKENLDHYNADKSDPLKLSLSFGSSFYNPDKPLSIEEVLSRADEKMHENKKNRKR
ncbi:MAG: GGDEF domain-containing protein [Nitrospirae bacterium]|nr:GGDEF domain-containing protein [Nitrospirota bacterium]